jgi:hypothetical protein
MSKVYVIPVARLNIDDLRKAFKQAKQDARATKAASNVEGEQDGSKPTT